MSTLTVTGLRWLLLQSGLNIFYRDTGAEDDAEDEMEAEEEVGEKAKKTPQSFQ